jgi:hypothetical protein
MLGSCRIAAKKTAAMSVAPAHAYVGNCGGFPASVVSRSFTLIRTFPLLALLERRPAKPWKPVGQRVRLKMRGPAAPLASLSEFAALD